MATYKVLQDIEAEDKLLGPLTLRQFIYAVISVVLLYFSFIVLTKGAPFLLVIFLPPALVSGFFAFPWGQDQPTELWALAKIRFLFKPRQRIWDQSGVKNLVTITAPKKIEKVYSDGLSQTEVKSRLRALSEMIDSRGWVIKNAAPDTYSQTAGSQSSDRLVGIDNTPQPVPNLDIRVDDDILDDQSNPVAQQLGQMIDSSTRSHRQRIIQQLNTVREQAAEQTARRGQKPPADYWFLNQSSAPATQPNGAVAAPAVVLPTGDGSQPAQAAPYQAPVDEKEIADKLRAQSKAKDISYARMHKLKPAGKQSAAAQNSKQPSPPQVTPRSDAAILNLANNDDLDVATIARQAGKARKSDEPPRDEVVISLH